MLTARIVKKPASRARAKSEADSPPWSWSVVSPTAEAMPTTSSICWSRNTPTASMPSGTRSTSSFARSAVTVRGLFAAKTNPTASAPASTAASTVSGVERPQILIQR